jgi:superfamily II DNA or RNA helicase
MERTEPTFKNAYLGKRGYTLFKSELDTPALNAIREALTARPFVPKSPQQMPPFKIYRETKDKMFVPRYYGLDTFGPPRRNMIAEGDTMEGDTMAFVGGMRDYQCTIVDKFIAAARARGGGLLEVDTGLGKTVIGINIASRLRKKTLIIVHKDFLLNQWIERIEQFMPGARVGRIQGPTIDVADKDIVIAMLQSISMKHYDPALFDCFGFTIIDEVHHMGAEVFSQALQKVVTPYVLGLSATMARKDGLTNVFKMFMGDIVHTEKRDTSAATVNVRAYEYRNNDEEFSEMKFDYRGNPLYSTMIKKLCECDDRSEYILDIIQSTLDEFPELQMMVMAHNKSLLKYLYEGAIGRGIAGGSVGYYLGGMKTAKLKESEDCRLILGTYAMASEGLDIKSLGALVMATPKSDVIQTTGRILRTTEGRKLIVDVVDQHDIFQNQHAKRKAFYRKQKYAMSRTNVGAFRAARRAGTQVEWEVVKGKKERSTFDECLL